MLPTSMKDSKTALPQTTPSQSAFVEPSHRSKPKSKAKKFSRPSRPKSSASPGVTSTGASASPGSRLIGRYHAIEKELARTTDPIRQSQLKREQESLGGLQAYQATSLNGGDKIRGGETGKWCAQQLIELQGKNDIRLLDVGAIAGTSYAKYPWITTTNIDLNPQSEKVAKFDFFDYPVPKSEEELFDVVGLSLVLNFVGDLVKRTEMLRLAHRFLRPSGYLYLVLPLACTANSRYLTPSRLLAILTTLGWNAVRQHDSAKLTYWLLQRDGDGEGDGKKWKKEEVRGGLKRNNFCLKV